MNTQQISELAKDIEIALTSKGLINFSGNYNGNEILKQVNETLFDCLVRNGPFQKLLQFAPKMKRKLEDSSFYCIKCGKDVDVTNDLDLEFDSQFVCHHCVKEYLIEVLGSLD